MSCSPFREACIALVAVLEELQLRGGGGAAEEKGALTLALQSLRGATKACRCSLSPDSIRLALVPTSVILTPHLAGSTWPLLVLEESSLLVQELCSCGDEKFAAAVRGGSGILISLVAGLSTSLVSLDERHGSEGLTAGMEAAELGCLGALRAVLSISGSQWPEGAAGLASAAGGGLIAQTVQISLQLSKQAKVGGDVKRAALGVVTALIRDIGSREMWEKFLPGTLSGAYEVLSSATRAPEVEAALQCIVQLLLRTGGGDEVGPASAAAAGGSALAGSLQALLEQGNAGPGRDKQAESGAESTAEDEKLSRLELILSKVTVICRRHASPVVRGCLAEGASSLLVHCHLTLRPCLLGALMALRWDTLDAVACAAEKGLRQFRESMSLPSWLGVRSFLVEQVAGIVDMLPHLTHSAAEVRLREQLDLLSSHIDFLGEEVRVALSVGGGDAIQSFCSIMEVSLESGDRPLEPLVSDVLASGEEAAMPPYHRKLLVHCRQEATWASASRALRLLGRHLDPWSLVDILVSGLSEQRRPSESREGQLSWARRRLPLLVVLMEAVRGMAPADRGCPEGDEWEGPADAMISSIASADVWNLQTLPGLDVPGYAAKGSTGSVTAVPSGVMQANALVVSFHLELIGALAEATGEAFEPQMMKLSYLLLEKLADDHSLVKQAALATLHRIRRALQEPSLAALLASNMDYIVDRAVALLREGGQGSAGLASVVSALLSHCGQNTATPLIRDLSKAILSDVDSYWWREETAMDSVSVLCALVRSLDVRDLLPPQKPPPAQEVSAPPAPSPWLQQVVLDLADPDDVGKVPMGGEPDHHERSSFDEEGEEDKGKKLAERSEVQLILQVLDRCRYFLASRSLRVAVMAVHTIGTCWSKLSAMEACDPVLLPSVHRMWPALTSRIKGAVTEEATALAPPLLGLVASIAGACGDFLGPKVREDLWPLLKGAGREVARSGTADARLMSATFACLGALCEDRHCRRFMAPLAAEAAQRIALPALESPNQETALEAGRMLRILAGVDGDGLWHVLWRRCHTPMGAPLPGLLDGGGGSNRGEVAPQLLLIERQLLSDLSGPEGLSSEGNTAVAPTL